MVLVNPLYVSMYGSTKWYDSLLEGAIWLGLPGLSSGDSLYDAVNRQDGTITASHVRTAWSINNVYKTAFRGNGIRYIDLPVDDIGLDHTQFTVDAWVKLAKHDGSNNSGIFTAYIDSTNCVNLTHNGVNDFWLYHRDAGTTVTAALTNVVPEQELVLIRGVVTSTTIDLYIYHADGVLTASNTVTEINSAFTSIRIGDDVFDNPAQTGTQILIARLSNEAGTQAEGQAIYDQYATTLFAESVLSIITPHGAVSSNFASGTGLTADVAVFDVGTSDYVIEITSNSDPVTDVTQFIFRYTPNSTDYMALEFNTSGQALLKEYEAGTPTTVGTINSVESDVLRIAVSGEDVAIYVNGATTASVSVTWSTSGNKGTNIQATVAGTHNFDYTIYDTFGIAPASAKELLQSEDGYGWENGALAEVNGYSSDDITANELRRLNNEFLFSESDSYGEIANNTEWNTDVFTRVFLMTQFGAGGGDFGRLYEQTTPNRFHHNSSSGISTSVDYNTTDALITSNNYYDEFGDITVAGTTLKSDDTLEVYKNGEQRSLNTDTTGSSSRTAITDAMRLGNSASDDRAHYGTMGFIGFLPFEATESLMYWIQQRIRIFDYYQNPTVSPTVHLIPQPDGNFYDIAGGSSVSGTNTALASSQDKIGAYPITFNGSSAYVDLFSAGIITTFPTNLSVKIRCEFDNWASGNREYLLYLRGSGGTNYIHIQKTSGNILEFGHRTGGTTTTLTHDVSGLTGEYTIHAIATASNVYLWVDDELVDSDTVTAIPEGAPTSVTLGRDHSTLYYSGTISEFQYHTSELSMIQVLQEQNRITTNGANYYDFLNSDRTMSKLNNAHGNNLLASGGADDTLSGATADGGFAPNGEIYIDFTSASHLNIGLTSLVMNGKRYSIWVKPSATAVGATAAHVWRLYIDSSNSIQLVFTATAGQLRLNYATSSGEQLIDYNSAVADTNYFVEVDIPESGGTAQMYINGSSVGTFALSTEISGTALSDSRTLVGASFNTNSNPLLSHATNLQIGSIPEGGASDYSSVVGIAL